MERKSKEIAAFLEQDGKFQQNGSHFVCCFHIICGFDKICHT